MAEYQHTEEPEISSDSESSSSTTSSEEERYSNEAITDTDHMRVGHRAYHQT